MMYKAPAHACDDDSSIRNKAEKILRRIRDSMSLAVMDEGSQGFQYGSVSKMSSFWGMMWVCTHMHMYMCIYIYIYMCTCIYVYMYVYVYVYIYMYMYIYVCTHICTYIYICIHIYFIYVYVHTCVYIQIYIRMWVVAKKVHHGSHELSSWSSPELVEDECWPDNVGAFLPVGLRSRWSREPKTALLQQGTHAIATGLQHTAKYIIVYYITLR